MHVYCHHITTNTYVKCISTQAIMTAYKSFRDKILDESMAIILSELM